MSQDSKKQRFGAVVVYNSPQLRDPKVVACASAQKALQTRGYICIREMIYSSLLDIYVAIFQLPEGR